MERIKIIGYNLLILFLANVFYFTTSAASAYISPDYNGYYIGKLTNADGLNISEDGGMTIGLDGTYYEVSDDFDYSKVTTIWVEEPEKIVVCEFKNGQITRLDILKDVVKPVFSINTSPDSFVYQNGKYQKDTITVKVKAGMDIKNTSYNSEMISNAKGNYASVELIQFNIISDQLVFGDNNSQSISTDLAIPFGETKICSYTMKINNNFVPDKINTNIELSGKIELKDGIGFDCKSQYISVGNIDLQKKKVSENENKSSVDICASKARLSLNSNMAVALDSNFSNYFSKAQQKEIEEYITIWLSEIVESQTFKSDNMTEKLQEKVRKKICDKLGVSIDTYLITKTTRASTTIIGDTISYGKRKIKLSVKIDGYSLDESSGAYASFGQIEYEVVNKNDISKIPTSGTGIITYANVESFANQVGNIADSAIGGAYSEIWGNNANKVAGLFVNTPFDKLLSGKFADNVYTLLKKPTEDYVRKISVKCPVDVNVYTWDGKLCGVIKDNVIDPQYEEIFISVNQDEKNIYLTEDDYIIELTSNDSGEMEYDIEEFADGKAERTVGKTSIPLNKGKKYYALLPEMEIDHDVFTLVDHDGENIEFSNDSDVWSGRISEHFSGGDGSRNNPFQISCGEDLAKLANDVNNGNSYDNTYFVLTSDIVLNRNFSGSIYDYDWSSFNKWDPIGYWETENDYSYFKGCFDGNNHIISNMIIESKRFSGLFGEIEDAIVENVQLRNVNIFQSAGYNTTAYAGGIVSYVEQESTVRNCSVDGYIYMDDYYGTADAGGVIGYSYGDNVIENCTNYIMISGKCGRAGGIAGSIFRSQILNCVNRGIIGDKLTGDCGGISGSVNIESEIKNCENYGLVSGIVAGGIAGINRAMIDGCKNYTDIYIQEQDTSFVNCVGGIVGKQDAPIDGRGNNFSQKNGIVGCINLGDIDVEKGIGGGIVGSINANTYGVDKNKDIEHPFVHDCVNYGNVSSNIAGGIAGSNNASMIRNCFNRGNVSSKEGSEICIGGIIGKMTIGYRQKDIPQVCNVYNTGVVSNDGNAGSIAGYIKDGVITNAYYKDISVDAVGKSEGSFVKLNQIMKIDDTIKNKLNGWVLSQSDKYNFWMQDETNTVNEGYPYFYETLIQDSIPLNEKEISWSIKKSEMNSENKESIQKKLYIISESNEKYENVLWASSNEQVVKVDSDGLITVVGEGKAVVRCLTEDYKSASCSVSVTILNDDSDIKDSTTNNPSNNPSNNTGTTQTPITNSSNVNSTDTVLDAITDQPGSILVDAGLKCKVKVISSADNNPTVEYIATIAKETYVKVPDAVTVNNVTYKVVSVGKNAFSGNKNIKNVVIGKNVKVIGKNAFTNCIKLKKVDIQSTVLNKIGANAFSGCKKLANIKIKSTKLKRNSIGKNILKDTSKKLIIKVPKYKMKDYQKYFLKKGNRTLTVKGYVVLKRAKVFQVTNYHFSNL